MVALALHLASSVLTTFAMNIYVLGSVYLLNGISISSSYCCSFTLGMEMIGEKWRHVTGIAVTGFWSLGMLWVCMLAYFLRDWQHLQLAASCPIILFALYFFLVPESARWLIRKGRYIEADAIIARAAVVNKRSLPEKTITREQDDADEPKIPQESILALVKCPRLLLRALVVFFNWAVCSLTYYGLGLNVGALSGNIFLNFALSAIFELAAFFLIILAMFRVGRKFLYCSSISIGGLACILTLLPVFYANSSYMWTVTLLAMVGKFGVSGAFAIIWLFTSEMFPTSVRAGVTSTSSFCARVGGIIASYIANLSPDGDVGIIMPQIVFGIVGLSAGVMACMLPETQNRHLPETVIEAVKMSRSGTTTSVSINQELQPMAKGEEDDDDVNA